tara:strand:+ start:244 stop:786 length:543 start_codon:yes stop_codon:yes gene_type:complete
MKIEWKIKEFEIALLCPFEKNPRFLTKDQYINLKKSLEKFGLTNKPLVTNDLNIISGHQRIKIMYELGYNSIECLVPSKKLTDKEIEELNIRMNKNSGEWDFDILANIWDEEELIEYGFTEKDLGLDPESLLNEALEEDKPKHAIVTLKIENISDLEGTQVLLDTLIQKIDSASYKVKIK